MRVDERKGGPARAVGWKTAPPPAFCLANPSPVFVAQTLAESWWFSSGDATTED